MEQAISMREVHFHIRWSGGYLDWQVFATEEDAERSARELVQPSEEFTVEQFDGRCPQCDANLKWCSAK